MGSSFCRHENREKCMLLKSDCEPGKKGCVLAPRMNTEDPAFRTDKAGFKRKGIARFKLRNKD